MTDDTREDNVMFDLEQLMEFGLPTLAEVLPVAPAPQFIEEKKETDLPFKLLPAQQLIAEQPEGLPIKSTRIEARGYTIFLQNGQSIHFKATEASEFHNSIVGGMYYKS